MINYGPWDRLAKVISRSFPVSDPSPAGANYYPADMTDEAFEALADPAKQSLYTLIRRDDDGDLMVVPYHQQYAEPLAEAADLLRQASELSDSEDFARYLRLRRMPHWSSDDYQPSDMAWLDVRDKQCPN